MDQLTLATELTRIASTQYRDFAFTSVVRWGDRYIATAKDGIYEIEAGDTDEGGFIGTRADLPVTDLGAANQKRLRRIYAAGEFNAVTIGEETKDEITLYVKADEGQERAFALEPQSKDGKQVGAKADIARDAKGRHWQIRWETDGMDYSIDSMSALIVNLFRKPDGL